MDTYVKETWRDDSDGYLVKQLNEIKRKLNCLPRIGFELDGQGWDVRSVEEYLNGGVVEKKYNFDKLVETTLNSAKPRPFLAY